MKKLITVLIICLLFTTPHLHAQSWQWARQNTSGYLNNTAYYNGSDYSCTATDPFGSVYLFGTFTSPTISFGSYTIYNNGVANMYLVKYDSAGNVKWLRGLGNLTNIGVYNQNYAHSIATNASGDVFVTGDAQDDSIIYFGAIALHSLRPGHGVGMFLAKFDSSGNAIWARTNGGNIGTAGRYICIDHKTENIYLLGQTYMVMAPSTMVFGTLSVPVLGDVGNTHIFVVKYDSSGDALWAKSAGGNDYDGAISMAIDDSGNVFIPGFTMSSTINFGSLILPIVGSTGYSQSFLIKYDSLGNIVWAKSIVGNYGFLGNYITIDAMGNIYLEGETSSTLITYNSSTFSYETGNFILKCSASGNIIWIKNIGNLYTYCLTNDNDNIYLGAHFIAPLIFGLDTINSIGLYGGIVVKLDTTGNLIWLKTTYYNPSSIASSVFGNIYISGSFERSFDLGTILLTNPDSTKTNVFIAKLDTAKDTQVLKISKPYNDVVIYPNPSNGLVNIGIPQFNNIATISILDIEGRTILTTNTNCNNIAINLGQYLCGVYFVVVNADGVIYENKLILK